MKKILLGSVLAFVVSGAAFAADLPARRAPPVFVPVPPPAFTWTGFYLGVNAGYAFDGDETYNLSANGPVAPGGLITGARTPFFKTRADGFTGGAQIGYNYELGSLGGLSGLVVGVEADAAYTDLRSTGAFVGTTGGTSIYQSRTDYVGTVRGRLGYAFQNFLVYGTGGFAYGGVRDNLALRNAAGATTYNGAGDTIKTGYAYGGGVEYAIPTSSFLNFFNSSAVTLKAEFTHYDLGSSNILVGNLAGLDSGYNARVKTSGNLVRAGINYKFDLFGAPAPVVARY